MATAIIGLCSLIFGAIWYVWKRKLDRVETPVDRIEKNHKAVENEIVHDDEDSANARIDDQLNRLRARKSNLGGQADKAGEGGAGIHANG